MAHQPRRSSNVSPCLHHRPEAPDSSREALVSRHPRSAPCAGKASSNSTAPVHHGSRYFDRGQPQSPIGHLRRSLRVDGSFLGMRIDAGSHGMLEALPRLVDPTSGSIFLKLVPVFLSRLHPPELRGEFVPCGGDPQSPFEFPLLRGASPVDVELRGGMTPSEVSAGLPFEYAGSQWSRSWWRWIATALTPFGWVMHATPQFMHQGRGKESEPRLALLELPLDCGGSWEPNDHVACEWLVRELGEPHEVGERDSRRWRYEWGSVWLHHEPRDGRPEAGISWEPFSSEMTAEIEERLGSRLASRGIGLTEKGSTG